MKTTCWTSAARRLGTLAASMVVALSGTPAAVTAETPVARLVMYEVAEELRFKPRAATDPSDFRRRIAEASLLGTDVRPLAKGTPFAAGQFVGADATSNVDLATGRGPVGGEINLLVDLDPTRNSLDTLLVVATIAVAGELDLTTASQGFAGIDGTWNMKQSQLGGPFTGFFVIPFQRSGKTGFWYVNLGPGACAAGSTKDGPFCSLTEIEFVLGIPLTKAVVVLSDR